MNLSPIHTPSIYNDSSKTPKTPKTPKSPYKKGKIPKALRETIWLKYNGKVFEAKCNISWCKNITTVYDFSAGHNKPESKGGETTLNNLVPICARCNLSMSNNYTIDEWNTLLAVPSNSVPIVPPSKKWCC